MHQHNAAFLLTLLGLLVGSNVAIAQTANDYYATSGGSLIDQLSGAAPTPSPITLPNPNHRQRTIQRQSQGVPPRNQYSNRGDVSVAQYQQPGAQSQQQQQDLAQAHRQSLMGGANTTGSQNDLDSQASSKSQFSSFSLGQQLNKIALNLIIVLAIATAASVILKQFQKAKSSSSKPRSAKSRNNKTSTSESHTVETMPLRVVDSLQVDKETSVTLLAIEGSKVLLTKDASGTKSVSVIPPAFEAALDETNIHTPQLADLPQGEHEQEYEHQFGGGHRNGDHDDEDSYEDYGEQELAAEPLTLASMRSRAAAAVRALTTPTPQSNNKLVAAEGTASPTNLARGRDLEPTDIEAEKELDEQLLKMFVSRSKKTPSSNTSSASNTHATNSTGQRPTREANRTNTRQRQNTRRSAKRAA